MVGPPQLNGRYQDTAPCVGGVGCWQEIQGSPLTKWGDNIEEVFKVVVASDR